MTKKQTNQQTYKQTSRQADRHTNFRTNSVGEGKHQNISHSCRVAKICLQIFYEALKGSGGLEGTHYWGEILTEYYSFKNILWRTYRIWGSSAKILFWASKKGREFQNSLRFFESEKTRRGELKGINYLGGIDTQYSCREVLLEVGRVSLIQNLPWKRGKSFIQNLRK